MGRRSLQASTQGIAILKKAIKRKKGGQTYLAGAVGCTRQTIWSLLQGNPTDCDVFMAVCEELALNWEDIAQLEAPEPEADLALDALVQGVRQKVHANIQKRCGEMRVLDMTRPIELDTIYTDVNILQAITGRRRLDLAELLKHCSLEEFDRLGFAHAHPQRRSGLEAVEEFDKLMLLGKPGAGKTTFLKRLATLCNSGTFQAHRVPIFITLKDFGDSAEKPKLLTYISEWLTEWGLQEPQKVEQILDQGRGFLLLDGLDEVSERASQQVLREIQSFSERFPKNAFVVSCRIAAREFTFQQFTEVEVADFKDEQIEHFATRWFESKQLVEKTIPFLEKLNKYPRIRGLATNPLLLTLLCLVFEGRTDFPSNRSELYEEGLDVLLKKWDGTRSIEREQVYRELSLKRKENLLSQLALTTFEPGNYFFKQKDAERLIEAYIQNLPGAQTDPEALRLDSEAVLKSIEAQHGLLVERARGIYSFSHLTFHEYLTARELATRDALHQDLIPHLTERRWREIFLLTTEMLSSADSFLSKEILNRTNSFLLTMKAQIDGLLATDEKLQELLVWVQHKASSVNALYTPVALRAFYLDRDLDLYFGLDPYRDLDLDFERDPYIDLELDLDLYLDSTLNSAFALDFDRDHDFDRTLDFTLAFDSAFDRAHILCLNPSSDSALILCLQKLKDELPDAKKERAQFRQWWETNGRTWIVELRAVMIEHRNIGHDWQFSDTQKQLRQQYYNANQLLVACLNSDCDASREVRQEIEDSLLLPIAEIEQNFPNQCRNR